MAVLVAAGHKHLVALHQIVDVANWMRLDLLLGIKDADQKSESLLCEIRPISTRNMYREERSDSAYLGIVCRHELLDIRRYHENTLIDAAEIFEGACDAHLVGAHLMDLQA